MHHLRLRKWGQGDICTFKIVFVSLYLHLCFTASQPLLNSLFPVLFRERPWPTSFPNSQPSSAALQFFPNSIRQIPKLASSGSSHQGILIAHPIYTNNYNSNNSPVRVRMPQTQTPQHVHSPSKQVTKFYYPSQLTTYNSHSTEYHSQNGPSEIQHQYQAHNNVLEENSITDETNGNSVINLDQAQEHTRVNQPLPVINFKPSPQVHEPFHIHSDNIADYKSSNEIKFQALGGNNNNLRYEGGFRPSRGQYNLNFEASDVRNVYGEYGTPWTNISSPVKKPSKLTKKPAPLRQDRQIVTASVSKSVVTTEMSVGKATPPERKQPVYTKPKNNSGTSTSTSSSDRIEDWIKVENENDAEVAAPVYGHKYSVFKNKLYSNGNLNLRKPVKCEFHRYGFCGVDAHYPRINVEKIASRCYTLLTHIISPQVKHNLATSSNGTIRERYSPAKRHNQRGWSWKTYTGSPLCNYLELTVTPGWAKDELGDWVVILQTNEWKQEAQISICTSSRAECIGPSCANQSSSELFKTRCVQRFAAQRVAVLDPQNQDRCPIIKSVFLPSACICISSNANSSVEQLDTSSSEISHITNVMRPGSNDTTFMIVTEKFTVNENT